jgi:Flp pilus assembly protein TadD
MTLTVARHYRGSFAFSFTPPITHLTQLSEDSATAPFAQVHLARLAVHRGENDAALSYARLAANATTDRSLLYVYVARMIAGQVGEAVGRQDLAEAEYRSALEILPGGQSAATALAGVLISAGRHAEAMDVMERALPEDAASEDP